MTLKAGDTLLGGKYRIQRVLGKGGFGFVYLARETMLNEERAIKELIPALVGDEAVLNRFLAEAKATMRLTHERIVRTYDIFREGDSYYIVMEYLQGGSLEEYLQAQGLLPISEVLRIATEVCDGLGYAHQRGVVHCDLKPANILLTASRSAKIVDFGIAHFSPDMLTHSWKTPTDFVAGTLPYMSPEQTDGVRGDPRIDIYALGAVMYRMLTGRPYLDFDDRETPRAQARNVNSICSQQPKPPSTYNKHIPKWLDGVVLRMLSKRPEGRYSSVEKLRDALESKKGHDEPVRTRIARTGARLPGWFWLLTVGAVALLLILGASLASIWTGKPGGKEVAGAGTTSVLTATWTPTSPVASKTVSLPTDTPAPVSTRTATPTASPSLEPETSTPAPPIPSASPLLSPTPKPMSPEPTATPTPPWFAAPTLTGPSDGMRYVGRDADIRLSWRSVGQLEADEFYVVRIPHPWGVEHGWTKQTFWQVPSYLYDLAPPSRELTWRVRVERFPGPGTPTPGEGGTPAGEYSTTRSFFWDTTTFDSPIPPSGL
ncbi:MAG: serine/threonine-protein kinase [Anaerolineae bacterium]